MSAYSPESLAHSWVGHLATYRSHRNPEHLEALVEEALRFSGLHLEDDLRGSSYWSEAPLARRVAVLLLLVDRGAVVRGHRDGQTVFEATGEAETWAMAQAALVPYLAPTLELLAALRAEQRRRMARSC